MNRSIEFKVSTFNDGVNDIYRTVTVDRWYSEEFGDYVFTFNGQVEHLSDSASFMNIVKTVYGDDLRGAKMVRDVSKS